MTKTRDLADLGGGFIQAGTGAVQRTVESKLQDVVSVKDFGAVGDGVTDDTAAIQAAFASLSDKGSIVINPGIYKLTDSISVSSKEIHVDARGAKFIVTANIEPFTFSNSEDAELVNIASNYIKGSTAISVSALSASYPRGYPVKVISNAVDPANRNIGAESSLYRVGEWAFLDTGSTTTTLNLVSPLRFTTGVDPTSTAGDEAYIDSYTTSAGARLLVPVRRSMSWIGGTFEFEDGHDGDGWSKPVILITGYVNPIISDFVVLRGYQNGISLKGCVGAKISNCSITALTSNPASSQFGYGISEGGTFGTKINNCTFYHTRHGYTTTASRYATNSTNKASLISSGRTQSSVLSNCVGVGTASGVATFDTHHDAESVIFSGCIAEGGNVGFALRGRDLQVSDCKIVNVNQGISVFTGYSPGDPDDDFYVAGKVLGATTAYVSDTIIESKDIPITTTACIDVRLKNLTLKSTSSLFVENNGSQVYISGTNYFLTTNYNGRLPITEVTNKGVFDLIAANAAISPYWTTLTQIDFGSSVVIDCKSAVDASSNLFLIRQGSSGQTFINNGIISADLSTDFTTLIGTTNFTGSSESLLEWSIDSASDDTISTTNLLGKYVRAYAKDGSVKHDWVSKNPKYYQEDPALSHVGTGAVVTNALIIPYEPAAYVNEDGHFIRYNIYFRTTGSAGANTITLRSGAQFLHDITLPSGAIGGFLDISCNTRTSDKLWLLHWYPVNASISVDTANTTVFKYSVEVGNFTGTTALRIDVDAPVGNTIFIDQYSIESDLLSVNV